jgi:dienelactone hydrolase
MKINKLTIFFLLATYCLTRPLLAQKEQQLKSVLGTMPPKPPLKIDTLEKLKIDKGWRYRIKFLAEDSNKIFKSPKDYIYAYVFVPDESKYKKLPGIIAIHQDGSHNYLGYLETAGFGGDADQHYGLELFKRGYIVICPDRFLHAERRRIAKPDTLADVFEQADIAEQHWVGQLQLMNRNFIGKEVYDLILTTDVLCKIPNLDKNRIGAIGHSAGGYVLAYFMFADKRIKAGASSCGVFELVDWFAEDAIRKRNVLSVIPGLAAVGRTSDYIGLIAPRPFLITRGLNEWGSSDDKQKLDSKRHV